MIRAVLFDFDGVLTTHPSGSFTTTAWLAEALDLSQAQVWDAFAPFNDDLLHGRTTHHAAWPTICARLGRDVGIDLLESAFDHTPMNHAMLALARRLAHDVAVGIVTDNKQDRIDRLAAKWRLHELFDPVVVSAAVGSGKTEAGIFEHALRHLRLPPQDVVFIDNTLRNLDVPAAMGLHPIHFDDAKNDVTSLSVTLHSRFGIGAAVAPHA